MKTRKEERKATNIVWGVILIGFTVSMFLYLSDFRNDVIGVILIPSIGLFLLKLKLKPSQWLNLYGTRLSINPSLGLHEHGIFWIPIIVFGWFALWIGLFSTEFQPQLLITDPIAVVTALKIPVTVFALCIPITVAVGRFHGSALRVKANEEAVAVRSFKHYFDHREAFSKHMENLKIGTFFGVLSVGEPLKLYEILFPNSSMTNFDITASDLIKDRIQVALSHTLTNLSDKNKDAENIPNLSLVDNGSLHILRSFGVTDNFTNMEPKADSYLSIEGYLSNISATYLKCLLHILDYADEFNRHEPLLSNESRKLISNAAQQKFLQFDSLAEKQIKMHLNGLKSKKQTKTVRLI